MGIPLESVAMLFLTSMKWRLGLRPLNLIVRYNRNKNSWTAGEHQNMLNLLPCGEEGKTENYSCISVTYWSNCILTTGTDEWKRADAQLSRETSHLGKNPGWFVCLFLATLLPFERTACIFSTTPALLAYVNRAILVMEQQMSSTFCCKQTHLSFKWRVTGRRGDFFNFQQSCVLCVLVTSWIFNIDSHSMFFQFCPKRKLYFICCFICTVTITHVHPEAHRTPPFLPRHSCTLLWSAWGSFNKHIGHRMSSWPDVQSMRHIE